MAKVDYIMRVNNDTMGNLFIQMMRENLNPDLQLYLRGSEPNHKKAKKDKYHISYQRIPLKYANKIRIYIQDKDNGSNLGAVSVGRADKYRKQSWEAENKLFHIKRHMRDMVNQSIDIMDSINKY